MIFMSSVEVFDGTKGSYTEFDDVNPLNFYGELKAQVEDYIKENAHKYLIVRTGWNVGFVPKRRCVVSLTYNSILKQDAHMAFDNYFSIADVGDTARGLFLASIRDEIKVLHLCSTEIVNRFDLATKIKIESRRSNEMAFKKCTFEEIEYSEPRGRINDLSNNLSRKVLDIYYASADDIISKKIEYLDEQNS